MQLNIWGLCAPASLKLMSDGSLAGVESPYLGPLRPGLIEAASIRPTGPGCA